MKKIVLFFMCSFLLYAGQPNKNKDYIGNTIKILENMTPEEEYSLGKAQLTQLVTDKAYSVNSPKVVYLNLIVNTLILSSNKPYSYNGYKVVLVENKSLNAMALPGGIIVVHDGIFQHLSNEDQLASILAHEIGHIQERHNLDADKSLKAEDAVEIGSKLAIGNNVDNKYAQVATATVLDQISNSIVSGYGVSQEAESDALALKIMSNSGYDPNEFLITLNKLKETTNSYGGANYPEDRLSRLEPMIKDLNYDKDEVTKSKELRTKRFNKYKQGN